MKKIGFQLCAVLLAAVVYTNVGDLKLGWDAEPGTVIGCDTNERDAQAYTKYYEIDLLRLGRGAVPVDVFHYRTDGPETNKTIMRPRSGEYVVKLRRVTNGCNGEEQFSPWCASNDPACSYLKDGNPGGWTVLWKPSGPTFLFLDD